MGMVVFMADQHAFAGSSHAILLVVFLQPLQSRQHRRIFLWLILFRSECVVAERKEADSLGLVRVEGLREKRSDYDELAC